MSIHIGNHIVNKADSLVGATYVELDSSGKPVRRKDPAFLKRVYERAMESPPAMTAQQYADFEKGVRTPPGFHWCGVFATYCIKKSVLQAATWVQRRNSQGTAYSTIYPQIPPGQQPAGRWIKRFGAGFAPLNLDDLKMGDICVTNDSRVHHVIISEDPAAGATSFACIEGNADTSNWIDRGTAVGKVTEVIKRGTIKRSEIGSFYRVVEFP